LANGSGLGVVLLVVLASKARGAAQPQRDPQRMFTTAQRGLVLAAVACTLEHRTMPSARSDSRTAWRLSSLSVTDSSAAAYSAVQFAFRNAVT
jgi:hypothetical protein